MHVHVHMYIHIVYVDVHMHCMCTVCACTVHHNLTVHTITHMYTCVNVQRVEHCIHYANVFNLQSEEFDVYINYASTYREAVQVLENIFLRNDKAVEYLKVCTVQLCSCIYTVYMNTVF